MSSMYPEVNVCGLTWIVSEWPDRITTQPVGPIVVGLPPRWVRNYQTVGWNGGDKPRNKNSRFLEWANKWFRANGLCKQLKEFLIHWLLLSGDPVIIFFVHRRCYPGARLERYLQKCTVIRGPARTLPAKWRRYLDARVYTYVLCLKIENQYFFIMISMVLL